MKKQCLIWTAMAMLASSAMAVTTNTVQFGGDILVRDTSWSAAISAVDSNSAPWVYEFTTGPGALYEDTDLSNVTFSVIAQSTVASNVLDVSASYIAFDPGGVSRIFFTHEVISLKFSFSDPDNKILGLRLSGIGTYYNDRADDQLQFSDGVNTVVFIDTENNFMADYDTTGLTPLSTNNISTFELFVTVPVNNTGNGTALGGIQLEYIADTDPIEPPTPPLEFRFLAGTEFDFQPIGTTMTRTNEAGLAITLTTVDIIGIDGTSALLTTNDHRTDIGSTLNALGINSAGSPVGDNQTDFNTNEVWIASFDTNVYLRWVDLASHDASAGDVFKIFSEQFGEIELDPNASSDLTIFGSGELYISAGTELKFYMTAGVNVRLESIGVDPAPPMTTPTTPYEIWSTNYWSFGDADGVEGANPDFDAQTNYEEYLFGGDPTNGAVLGIAPLLVTGGNYIYTLRNDDSLTASILTRTDLVAGSWATNSTIPVTVSDGGLSSYTNAVGTAEDELFIRLQVD